MPDYSKGRIYTVRSWSRPDLIYVGSTTQKLSVRMGGHRAPNSKCKSKQIIDIGDAYIELLETYPCENRDELEKRENHHMRLMDCVNKNLANADCQHGRQHNYCKECGGSQICEHNRQKNQCKECGGIGRCEHNRSRHSCKECNGTAICEHNRTRNHCKICSPVECCGRIYAKGDIKKHQKTKKHIAQQV